MHDDDGAGTRRRFLAGAAAGMTTLSIGMVPQTASATATASATSSPLRPARGYAPWQHGLVHFYDTAAADTGGAPVSVDVAGARAGAAAVAGAVSLPLLLLHQAPMSSRQFEAGYAPLARRGIRAIGIDTPGFGMSDPTPFVPKIADWVPAVVAVLDHLGLAQVDVLGHHTGALLANELALLAPTRVRAVILNGPFPINAEEREARLETLQKNEIDFEYRTDGSHLVESFMRRYTMYGAGADPKVTTRVVVEKFQGFAPFWYGHNAAYRYDQATQLTKLEHRTLLLTNTGDSIYELAQRARRIRPDFEYTELKGGGIDIVEQQPEVWADAVFAFLRASPGASTGAPTGAPTGARA
jgi:pimeloyl-ACP methyl ester carboxylesterase